MACRIVESYRNRCVYPQAVSPSLPILLPPLSTYFIFRYSGRMKITNVIAVNTITAINLNQRINSSDGWRVYVKKKKKEKKNYNWIEGNEKLAEVAFIDEMFRETESATSSRVTYTYFIYIYIYFLVRFSPRFIIETLWKRYGNSKREGNGGWTQLREVNTRRSVRNYERSGGSPRRFISNLFRKSRRHLDTFNLPR